MKFNIGILSLVFLLGCQRYPEQRLTLLEGFGYQWEHQSHPISQLAFQVDNHQARLSVVGGPSTTGIVDSLEDGCEAAECAEVASFDTAITTLQVVRLFTRSDVWVTTGSVTVRANSTEASTTIDMKAPREFEFTTAWITGFRLNSDVSLVNGGLSCYRPAYGWLPKQLKVELEPHPDQMVVHSQFSSGLSFEVTKQCLDDIADRAQVDITLDYAFAGSRYPFTETQQISGLQKFGFEDQEPVVQQLPTVDERPLNILSLDGRIYGWNSLTFQFHANSERGAYLRSWRVIADPEQGLASGDATNYSPDTQLSSFDYTFYGSLQGIDIASSIKRQQIEAHLTPALDENGDAQFHDIPLPW